MFCCTDNECKLAEAGKAVDNHSRFKSTSCSSGQNNTTMSRASLVKHSMFNSLHCFQRDCIQLEAGFANLHVCLLAAAGAPRAFPVAQHAPHSLHFWWRQALVQLGFPGMLVLSIIAQAVPKPCQLVQLRDCSGVIITRGVVLTPSTAGRLLARPPVQEAVSVMYARIMGVNMSVAMVRHLDLAAMAWTKASTC